MKYFDHSSIQFSLDWRYNFSPWSGLFPRISLLRTRSNFPQFRHVLCGLLRYVRYCVTMIWNTSCIVTSASRVLVHARSRTYTMRRRMSRQRVDDISGLTLQFAKNEDFHCRCVSRFSDGLRRFRSGLGVSIIDDHDIPRNAYVAHSRHAPP